MKAELEHVNKALLQTQGQRDGALQRFSALAGSVGAAACKAAGVDATAAPQADSVMAGHLEKIAELEREVRHHSKTQNPNLW